MTRRSILILASLLAAAVFAGSASAFKSAPGKRAAAKGAVICPVMEAPVAHPAKAPFLMVNNERVPVCCPGCIGEIKKHPAKYLKKVKDPVSGKPFALTAKSPRMEHQGALFLFANAKTHKTFHAHPGKFHKAHAGHNPHKGHNSPGKHEGHDNHGKHTGHDKAKVRK